MHSPQIAAHELGKSQLIQKQKGGDHALDNFCHSLNIVAGRIGQWLHVGWSRSYPPGHRHRCGGGPSYSRKKTIVRIWTLAWKNEVFGEEVVSRPGITLPNYMIASVDKDVVINQMDCKPKKKEYLP